MESWQPYPPKITTLKICPRTWRNSSQLLSRKKWIVQNAKPAKNISLDTSRKLINQNGIELYSTCLLYLIQVSILIQSYKKSQFLCEIGHMNFLPKIYYTVDLWHNKYRSGWQNLLNNLMNRTMRSRSREKKVSTSPGMSEKKGGKKLTTLE